MYSNNKYGSKERLFELMYGVKSIKNTLNEGSLSTEYKDKIINEFIDFADNKLDLGNNIPKISISYKEGEAKENKSFGGYSPNNESILVVGANRNLADILRSLAHELVHHKQNLEDRIEENSGETGSDIENEANARAGIIMREFGKLNPDIFE